MKYVLWSLVLLLVILHQDNWFWESDTLLFGFMPIALFYHACISLAAGITWYLATVYCWPHELEHALGSFENDQVQAGTEAGGQ